MIRALALFSLTMLAACWSSSHAAPALAQGQCMVAQPEDPYGEDGNAALAGSTWCGPGKSCDFSCDEGGCAFACAEGSTCNIGCDGGNCKVSCGINATCNVECDGGRCGVGCGVGSTCNAECDGGSCATACADEATCNTECDGGNCV